jgi:hypothetical protein
VTIARPWLTAVGRTPESRVQWAIRFVGLDLARLSDSERQRTWAKLAAYQGLPPRAAPPAPPAGVRHDSIAITQQELRDCLAAFAEGLPATVDMPEATWSLWPPRRGRGRRRGRITRVTGQHMLTANLVLAVVDDLNAIGADRLRACPLVIQQQAADLAVAVPAQDAQEADVQRCGAIFLSESRQLYCTIEHARAASWRRYVARGGPDARKGNRKDVDRTKGRKG